MNCPVTFVILLSFVEFSVQQYSFPLDSRIVKLIYRKTSVLISLYTFWQYSEQPNTKLIGCQLWSGFEALRERDFLWFSLRMAILHRLWIAGWIPEVDELPNWESRPDCPSKTKYDDAQKSLLINSSSKLLRLRDFTAILSWLRLLFLTYVIL